MGTVPSESPSAWTVPILRDPRHTPRTWSNACGLGGDSPVSLENSLAWDSPPGSMDRIYRIYRMKNGADNLVNRVNPVHFNHKGSNGRQTKANQRWRSRPLRPFVFIVFFAFFVVDLRGPWRARADTQVRPYFSGPGTT